MGCLEIIFGQDSERVNNIYLALVFQKMDGALHWIILYPLDSVIGLPNTYPLDSDLSGGIRYPPFELGPEGP